MRHSTIARISNMAKKMIVERAPLDTGNLRDTIAFNYLDRCKCEITIGGSPAPYAVYTNEKWVSPMWRGKKNPNEHWIDLAVQEVVQAIAIELGGKVTSADGEADRWENKSYWDKLKLEQAISEEQYTYIDG